MKSLKTVLGRGGNLALSKNSAFIWVWLDGWGPFARWGPSASSRVVLSRGQLSLRPFGTAAGSGGVFPEGRLLQRDLDDVLLDDLALRNRDDLRGPLAAQSREWTAPREREGPPERHLHGLAAGNLAPFPRLPLQTLDSLRRTEHRGAEVKPIEEAPDDFCRDMQNLDTRRRTKASTLPWLHCLGLFLRQCRDWWHVHLYWRHEIKIQLGGENLSRRHSQLFCLKDKIIIMGNRPFQASHILVEVVLVFFTTWLSGKHWVQQEEITGGLCWPGGVVSIIPGKAGRMQRIIFDKRSRDLFSSPDSK